MAAGLGFKTFAVGEVLTAADTNGYLMQGVLVFASAAARDAAITSPQEGQFAYLKDTNVTTYYTGSAWANLDTTGMVNPMTTTGDTIYSSSGSTPARLAIGATGNVLTVAGGVPTWAAPAGGSGLSLSSIASGSLSGTSLTLSSLTAYDTLVLRITNASDNTEWQDRLEINGTSTGVYDYILTGGRATSAASADPFIFDSTTSDTSFKLVGSDESITSTANNYYIILTNCKSAGFTTVQSITSTKWLDGSTNRTSIANMQGIFKSAAAVSSIKFFPIVSSTYDAGTYALYGG